MADLVSSSDLQAYMQAVLCIYSKRINLKVILKKNKISFTEYKTVLIKLQGSRRGSFNVQIPSFVYFQLVFNA